MDRVTIKSSGIEFIFFQAGQNGIHLNEEKIVASPLRVKRKYPIFSRVWLRQIKIIQRQLESGMTISLAECVGNQYNPEPMPMIPI